MTRFEQRLRERLGLQPGVVHSSPQGKENDTANSYKSASENPRAGDCMGCLHHIPCGCGASRVLACDLLMIPGSNKPSATLYIQAAMGGHCPIGKW